MSTPAYDVSIDVRTFSFNGKIDLPDDILGILHQLLSKELALNPQSVSPYGSRILKLSGLERKITFSQALERISYFFAFKASDDNFWLEVGSPGHLDRFNNFLYNLKSVFQFSQDVCSAEFLPFDNSFGSFTTSWDCWFIFLNKPTGEGISIYLNAVI